MAKSDFEHLMQKISRMNMKAHEFASKSKRFKEQSLEGSSAAALQTEYVLTYKKSGFDLYGSLCEALTSEEMRELENNKENLEKILSGECPLCGMDMVDFVFEPFEFAQAAKETWDL